MNDTRPDRSDAESKPKILVDEDWKSHVAAEKDAWKHPPSSAEARREAEPTTSLPAASFALLVTTLTTQATLALGQPLSPESQEMHVDLAMAKHLIDTLGVFEEKTKGNLTGEESDLLSSVLYQLRMAYVAVQSHVPQAERAGKTKSSLELP